MQLSEVKTKKYYFDVKAGCVLVYSCGRQLPCELQSVIFLSLLFIQTLTARTCLMQQAQSDGIFVSRFACCDDLSTKA